MSRRELVAVAEPENPTDLGNARRLVRLHGHDLRHCHQWRTWLVWDDRRWDRDRTGEVARRAKRTVMDLYGEASRTEDESGRKAIAKHARSSENRRRLEAMVEIATSEVQVAVDPSAFDADPWFLTVLNGTLDLRTGQLRMHERGDLITKLAPVEYDPHATHPDWDRFLASSTGGDRELVRFLARVCGYSLTGDNSEEKLFFLHGPTATGKSTLLEAIKAAIGQYAVTADFEVFTKRTGDRGATNDLARLAGARFVTAAEVDEGKRLAEGLLKQVTGGDTVAARHLYSEFFEFEPRFKLWLAANSRPSVTAADGAIWRRIVQIPFTHQVPEADRDPRLKRRLKTDPDLRAAVLRWAVAGCLDWREGGLRIPQVVKEYTAGYRAENDHLAAWIADSCELDPSAESTAAALRRSYETWARAAGEEPVSPRSMAAGLRAHGCEQVKRRDHRAWRGLVLRGRAR